MTRQFQGVLCCGNRHAMSSSDGLRRKGRFRALHVSWLVFFLAACPFTSACSSDATGSGGSLGTGNGGGVGSGGGGPVGSGGAGAGGSAGAGGVGAGSFQLLSAEVISGTEVLLTFSEPVVLRSGVDPADFRLS